MIFLEPSHNSRFSVYSNRFPQSTCLSLEAKALLRYLISRPDNWRVCKNALKTALGVGRCVLDRVVAELVNTGYLMQRSGTYVVLEDPSLAQTAADREEGIVRLTREQRRDGYTITNDAPFLNAGLSLRARGMLCYLLTLPPDWQINSKALAKATGISASITAAVLKDLESAGHVARTPKRGDKGWVSGWVFDIYETPRPHANKPQCGLTDDRITDNQHVTRIQSKEKTEDTKEPLNPLTDKQIETVSREDFESLVAVYPKAKRGNLDDAFGEYQAAIRSGEPVPSLPDLVSIVTAACGSEQWSAEYGRFVPLLKNWLRDRRWNEVLSPVIPIALSADTTPAEILASADKDTRRLLKRRLEAGVISAVTPEAFQQAALDCIGNGWAKIRLSGYHEKAYRHWARLVPDELATTPGLEAYLKQHDPYLLVSVNEYLEAQNDNPARP